jgi:hypothetical protein
MAKNTGHIDVLKTDPSIFKNYRHVACHFSAANLISLSVKTGSEA